MLLVAVTSAVPWRRARHRSGSEAPPRVPSWPVIGAAAAWVSGGQFQVRIVNLEALLARENILKRLRAASGGTLGHGRHGILRHRGKRRQ